MKLTKQETERALFKVKQFFVDELCKAIELEKVSAPLFVAAGAGINDDLNGVEKPVSFQVGSDKISCEIVQSLAKWKRVRLGDLKIPAGQGIVTDMRAIRPDDITSDIHSHYVDQWDWEKTITAKDRKLDYLIHTVENIYKAIVKTEKQVAKWYPSEKPVLPKKITFIHTEDLLAQYPNLTPKEREDKAAKEYGAIFLIGIGGEMPNGEIHDGRAPDYDDWTTPTSKGKKGLNGDIILWNPILKRAFEVSSMGIRVDKKALQEQLKIRKATEREKMAFHQSILNSKIPLSMGGGIGQSRLCMFMLRKKCIAEVQHGVWPKALEQEWKSKGYQLL